jgi:hypothetical protein
MGEKGRKKERKSLDFGCFGEFALEKIFVDYLAIHLGNVCVTGKKRLSSETFCANTLSLRVSSFASTYFSDYFVKPSLRFWLEGEKCCGDVLIVLFARKHSLAQSWIESLWRNRREIDSSEVLRSDLSRANFVKVVGG